MSPSTRRLGRGLDSLVSNLAPSANETDSQSAQPARLDNMARPSQLRTGVHATMLAVNQLTPNPHQPRSMNVDHDVVSLAESIKRSGFVQPIAVRRAGQGYQIIAGERRWLAAKSLGLTEIPALVREASDEQMLELALIENIQREDLNAIDRANAYRQFCTAFNLTPEEVGRRLGEDRSTVANYLRLLDLPGAIQQLVADGAISMGHARCLLGVVDEPHRARLAESVVHNQLSVRALEEIVRRERTPAATDTEVPQARHLDRSAHLADIQQRFEEAVKTKVTIRESRKRGTGRITIEYYSLDEFDRIASLLGVQLD